MVAPRVEGKRERKKAIDFIFNEFRKNDADTEKRKAHAGTPLLYFIPILRSQHWHRLKGYTPVYSLYHAIYSMHACSSRTDVSIGSTVSKH